jgi:hypothetical protein
MLTRVVQAEGEFQRHPAADMVFAEGEVVTAVNVGEVRGDLLADLPGGDHVALVTVELALAAAEGSEEPIVPIKAGDDPLVGLTALFILFYVYPGPKPPSPAELEEFAWEQGLRDAWPYWREFAQSTINRMGLPGMTIGTFEREAPKGR